jgi:hypothetical protein
VTGLHNGTRYFFRVIAVNMYEGFVALLNEDGSQTTLTLDSTALACAVAAKHTSFTSPATSLASKTIVGFMVDDGSGDPAFPQYEKLERHMLASHGVTVVTDIGGRLELLDPVSTEVAGGGLTQFKFRSIMAQRDNVVRTISRAVDRNHRGVVPEDLADFILDIKITFCSALEALVESGSIGKFRDASGATREINLARDVVVQQSRTDATKYLFKFFWFGRYPALRFEGTHSVDNPFLGA